MLLSRYQSCNPSVLNKAPLGEYQQCDGQQPSLGCQLGGRNSVMPAKYFWWLWKYFQSISVVEACNDSVLIQRFWFCSVLGSRSLNFKKDHKYFWCRLYPRCETSLSPVGSNGRSSSAITQIWTMLTVVGAEVLSWGTLCYLSFPFTFLSILFFFSISVLTLALWHSGSLYRDIGSILS